MDCRFVFRNWAGLNRGHSYMDGLFLRDTDQPYLCQRDEPDFQTDHQLDFIDEVRIYIAEYKGMILCIDQDVGRI